MAGYNESMIMSNNAVKAYERGEKPLGAWNAKALHESIHECYPNDEEALLRLPTDIIQQRFLRLTGRHHVGAYFRTESFFSFIDDYNAMQIQAIISLYEKEIERRRKRDAMWPILETRGRYLAQIRCANGRVISDAVIIRDEMTGIIVAHSWQKMHDAYRKHNEGISSLIEKHKALAEVLQKKDRTSRFGYLLPSSFSIPRRISWDGFLALSRKKFTDGVAVVRVDEEEDRAELVMYSGGRDELPFDDRFDVLDSVTLEEAEILKEPPLWDDYLQAVSSDSFISSDFEFIEAYKNADIVSDNSADNKE